MTGVTMHGVRSVVAFMRILRVQHTHMTNKEKKTQITANGAAAAVKNNNS